MTTTSETIDPAPRGTGDDGRAPDEHRPHDDAGVASVIVLLLVPLMLALGVVAAGLWSGYTARRSLGEMAEASARSAANAIDLTEFDATGRLVLDEDRAISFAFETLSLQEDGLVTDGTVEVVDGRVIVRLTGEVDVLGVGSVTIAAVAAATPQVESAVP